jgi:hypothetical protein
VKRRAAMSLSNRLASTPVPLRCSILFRQADVAENLQHCFYAQLSFQARRHPHRPDHGVHDLADETAAQIEAIRLARSLRETRSELAGRNYSIHVVDEYGKAVCVIPIDDI